MVAGVAFKHRFWPSIYKITVADTYTSLPQTMLFLIQSQQRQALIYYETYILKASNPTHLMFTIL